jgi:hypothetical protein
MYIAKKTIGSPHPSHYNTFSIIYFSLNINDTGQHYLIVAPRGKIRLIEGNAKYRHLKKLTCKGTSSRCLKPRTPYPSHPGLTLSILIHTGGELNQREG